LKKKIIHNKKIDRVSKKSQAISKIKVFLNTYQHEEGTASTLNKVIPDAIDVRR